MEEKQCGALQSKVVGSRSDGRFLWSLYGGVIVMKVKKKLCNINILKKLQTCTKESDLTLRKSTIAAVTYRIYYKTANKTSSKYIGITK